ncbi:MAG: SRPBCC family protein [Actinobacteria bacterium]|nr:SRPBCC family protein [Actinomycetota bacterium]MBU1944571.1 SRPBCC family protein [Actinomycetota bacterium]MBU2689124.1 SRPBCC family protein [Actinomycetota bacterium]
MADTTSAGLTDSITINAGVDDIKSVLLDFESYPDWMGGVEAMEVLKRDKKKRGTQVRYTVDIILRKISYVLSYSYDDKADRIDMGYVEGDLDDCNSYYEFEPLDDDRTEVTYHYDVSYSIPRALMNPVTKRLLKSVDKRVMNSALSDLKKRVERG